MTVMRIGRLCFRQSRDCCPQAGRVVAEVGQPGQNLGRGYEPGFAERVGRRYR